MSMVVRTNINSMNANRNLSINNSQVAKAIEKLASGYAINRAADDASGLAITEKMQAQITGLDQGTDNALEGIGLVQTAEGAMSEIHDMLNRIVELSTKSANGTIQDEVDREAVQAEVDVLVDEIDRIAQSTNYNGIDLLNGNLSDGGLVIKTNTYTETITTESTTGTGSSGSTDGTDGTTFVSKLNIDTSLSTTVGSFTVYGGEEGTDFSYTGGVLTILSSTDMRIEGGSDAESIVVNSADGEANLALNNVNITSSTGSAFSTGNNEVYIELEGENELSSTYGLEFGESGTIYGSAGLNVGTSGSISLNGVGVLTATGGSRAAGIGSNASQTSGTITINSGTIYATGGYNGAGIGSGSSGTIGEITINGGTIYATGGLQGAGIGSGNNGKVGNITINGGTIESTGGSQGAGIGSGWGLSSKATDITITGGTITATGGASGGAGIGSGYYATVGDITIIGGIIIATGGIAHQYGDIGSGAGIGSGYYANAGDITYVEEIVTATAGDDPYDKYGIGENVGAGVDGTVGTITTIPLPTTDDDDDTDIEYETTYTTTTEIITKTEVYNGDGLILHVADQNETYNKIRVYIDPMTGEALKIKPLYVYTQELAGAAINIVKDAINYVSTNRCNVGALQNRLEHTINGNNSTSENMTASKSAIKDADMAKEMMEFTKMNVLTQASQAMLAQSNQSTQQVLSLLG